MDFVENMIISLMQPVFIFDPILVYSTVSGNNLLSEDIIGGRKDVGHEGAVLDVLVITDDVDGIVTGLSGPVAHVTGAIALIVTLNFSL